MALQAAYRQFLAAPNSSALATNASLHYITTTTSFNGPTEIIKHLASLRNQVKKTKEELLHVVEGQNAIAIESETTLEFVSSGAVYLPALDDNFVADHSVSLPILHFVTFDSDGKITQVRQSWDQGALLKQLDVIGRTGRNWPIRDSKDQLRLIATSVKATSSATARPSTSSTSTSDVINRSRGNSTNILRDPHASLTLFAPREDADNLPEAVISPYAGGTRPRQKSFAELLGDESHDEPSSPSNGRQRSESNKAIAPKIGAGKNFQPMRLFDTEEDVESTTESTSKAIAPKIGAGKNFQPSRLFDNEEGVGSAPDTPDKNASPNKFYRPNPTKFQHFDFADGSDPQDAPKAGVSFDEKPKTKHDSNWSFDDFATPQKPVATRGLHRHQDVRHWDNENTDLAETPVGRVQQIKPRRDAETHFEFRDDGLPSNEPRLIGRPRGSGQNTGLGLYQNNLYNDDGSAPTPGPDPRALGNITNLSDRRKDFDAHFTITDESPQQGNGAAQAKAGTGKVSEDRMKAVKMMESNWGAYEKSPASQKENNNPGRKGGDGGDDRGINIAGDGMGGKKGSGRAWGIGDESDDERNARSVPGKKPGGTGNSTTIWDF